MYWLTDPGHGWLKVPFSALLRAGVADKISAYSYVRGKTVYLEEDCDAEIYLSAIGYPPGKEIPAKHANKRSRVRGYYPYTLSRAYEQQA